MLFFFSKIIQAAAIKRKQQILQQRLAAEPDNIAERLSSARPADIANRFLDVLATVSVVGGRTMVVVEAARQSEEETPAALALRCANYVKWGADAIMICTDEPDSPDGLADIEAVSRICRQVLLADCTEIPHSCINLVDLEEFHFYKF